MSLDLIVRGGTVFDGRGGHGHVADIGIRDGRIAEVGRITGAAAREIDADGLMVTPGFVDVHTHYDGQLIWSPHLSPSSRHGITTVVTGNCGVGFAPCRPADRKALMRLLEGVEDLPEIVLEAGLTWEWETFPEYIEAVRRRPHDIDFAVQIPHAPLRIYVMGERATNGRKAGATPEDLTRMRKLVTEAIRAGAVGFGTSRSVFHQSADGASISSVFAGMEELRAIAAGIRDAGHGVMQILQPLRDGRDIGEFGEYCRIAAETGIAFSYSCMQTKFEPRSWKTLLDMTRAANVAGARVSAQILGRPSGILLGLDLTYNPLALHPAYRKIARLPLDERVAHMRRPEVRAAILADSPAAHDMIYFQFARDFEHMYELGDPPNYEPPPGSSIASRARRAGISPDELAYDLMLERDGHAILSIAATNYEEENFDAIESMLRHPDAVPALGDGGAHYGVICDASYPTFMLAYWGRDRDGERLPLGQLVHMLTEKPARMMCFTDRGIIAPGYKADINLIDFDRLRLHSPRMVRDLPGGGRRIMQGADGYRATIVSGETIAENGQPTGALPGRLVCAGGQYT